MSSSLSLPLFQPEDVPKAPPGVLAQMAEDGFGADGDAFQGAPFAQAEVDLGDDFSRRLRIIALLPLLQDVDDSAEWEPVKPFALPRPTAPLQLRVKGRRGAHSRR
jgi:hypothetical protein